MWQIKHAVVGQGRIGWEIYLRSNVTQTSGEVKIAFVIRNPELCNKLSGPVLGLYTHLVHCSRRIRYRIQGKGNKRPYIEQGWRWNRGIKPEIAWGGAIFVAPLGVLTSSSRINLVDAAGFINPLLMERIICWIQCIFAIIPVCIRQLICTGHLFHTMIAPSTATAAR